MRGRHADGPDHAVLGGDGDEHQGAEPTLREQRHRRLRKVGDHDREVGRPVIRCARGTRGEPPADQGRRQATDRPDFVLVLEVTQHQQVRRVGRETVADAFDGQHQVVVEPEPHQRLVHQAEESRIGTRGPGPCYRSLDERPLVIDHHQHGRASTTLTTDVGGEHRHGLGALVQHGVGALPSAGQVRRGGDVGVVVAGHPVQQLVEMPPANLVGAPAEERRRVVVPCGHHPLPRELGHGDTGVTPGVTGFGRPPGRGELVRRPIEPQPHPLGRRGVVDTPRRGQREGDEETATLLRVLGGLGHHHRQHPPRMQVLDLDPHALGVEADLQPGGGPGVHHGVGDQLAHEQYDAVGQVTGIPGLQHLARKCAGLGDGSFVRREGAVSVKRQGCHDHFPNLPADLGHGDRLGPGRGVHERGGA